MTSLHWKDDTNLYLNIFEVWRWGRGEKPVDLKKLSEL